MIVDSSAIVSIILAEIDAPLFAVAIAKADGRSMSASTLLEASIVLLGRKPLAPAFQELDAFVAEARIQVEPTAMQDVLIAREAFRIYGKGRHPAKLNFGDCFTYALSRRLGRPILCKGNDFALTDASIVPLAAS